MAVFEGIGEDDIAFLQCPRQHSSEVSFISGGFPYCIGALEDANKHAGVGSVHAQLAANQPFQIFNRLLGIHCGGWVVSVSRWSSFADRYGQGECWEEPVSINLKSRMFRLQEEGNFAKGVRYCCADACNWAPAQIEVEIEVEADVRSRGEQLLKCQGHRSVGYSNTITQNTIVRASFDE